jgi:hypothetical protein
VPGHPFVLGVALLGPAEAHQLHLVELVYPDEATGVLAMGASLPPEAGRERAQPPWKISAFEDLVPVEIGQRHLGRRDEEQVVLAGVIQLLGELGKLAGARHRGAVHQQWRRDLEIPVFPRVQVEHEVLEARARRAPSGTGNLEPLISPSPGRTASASRSNAASG